MAKEAASSAGSNGDATSGKRGEADSNVSADVVSKVQGALDSTFGGVDDNDRQAPAKPEGGGRSSRKNRDDDDGEGGGDDERVVPVREHQRRVKGRRREAEGDDDSTGDDEGVTQPEAKPPVKPKAGKKAADPDNVDDDQGNLDDDDDTAGDLDGDGDGEGGPTGEAIPQHYIEAARRRGWSEDRIQRLIKADPDLAHDTFEQLHQDANSLSQEYAALGRTVGGGRQQQTQQQWNEPPGSIANVPGQVAGWQQQQPGQQQTQQQQQRGYLPAFAVPKEILDTLEEADPHRKVFGLVEQHMNAMNHVLANVLQPIDQFVQERRNEVVYEQIDTFFKSRKGFEKVYGTQSRSELIDGSPEHLVRSQVVQTAEMIRGGAAARGVNMTVQEALERAHSMVTSQFTKETARREITGQVRKRNGQITARPTHRTGGEAENHSKDPLAKATSTAAKKLREMNRNATGR